MDALPDPDDLEFMPSQQFMGLITNPNLSEGNLITIIEILSSRASRMRQLGQENTPEYFNVNGRFHFANQQYNRTFKPHKRVMKKLYNDASSRISRRRDDNEDMPPPANLQLGMGMKGTGNKWIQHVKAYASKHGMKYGEALKDPKCKNSYKR
jgi:hypothetical protein